ncbi:hypothetical protein [Streptomyces sp. V4I2]|nr:hypothetical protein [Streptomyces sp. V4I2]MDQ1042668.1 hypothetical protein [Streptomyces sp. V4I2]
MFVAPDGQKVTAADHRTAIGKAVTKPADGPQDDSAGDPFRTRSPPDCRC